ncbi:MAG: hypothetical protein M1816_000031 [Peltula sp. TS41687]|nr:MAG: hypothetical protein M1816_000031 [Peltula sp. TS41687]
MSLVLRIKTRGPSALAAPPEVATGYRWKEDDYDNPKRASTANLDEAFEHAFVQRIRERLDAWSTTVGDAE